MGMGHFPLISGKNLFHVEPDSGSYGNVASGVIISDFVESLQVRT
jgi:hypothetical protein